MSCFRSQRCSAGALKSQCILLLSSVASRLANLPEQSCTPQPTPRTVVPLANHPLSNYLVNMYSAWRARGVQISSTWFANVTCLRSFAGRECIFRLRHTSTPSRCVSLLCRHVLLLNRSADGCTYRQLLTCDVAKLRIVFIPFFVVQVAVVQINKSNTLLLSKECRVKLHSQITADLIQQASFRVC